jgi:hypothetical protein
MASKKRAPCYPETVITISSQPNSFGKTSRDLRGWWLTCAVLLCLSSDGGRALERSIGSLISSLSQVLHLIEHPTGTETPVLSAALVPRSESSVPVASSAESAQSTTVFRQAIQAPIKFKTPESFKPFHRSNTVRSRAPPR